MLRRTDEMTKREKTVSAVLLTLICLTLAFIFYQSLLPPSLSKNESDTVAEVLSLVFGEDSFVVENIRTIAHFLEYGLLGVEVSVYLCLFANKLFVSSAISFALSLGVAIFDETIQIFSGRATELKDVITDFSGFVILSLLTYAVYFSVFIRFGKGINKWLK